MEGSFVLVNVIAVSVGVLVFIALGLYFMRRNSKKNVAVVKSGKEDEEGGVTYPAYITRPGRWKFTQIREPIGVEYNFPPPFPVNGVCYLVKQEGNKLVPSTPLDKPIRINESSFDLYDALNFYEQLTLYIAKLGLWDRVKTFVPYMIVGAEILVMIIILDKVF